MAARNLSTVTEDVYKRQVHIPIILMGYLNPIMQYGFEAFCRKCALTGVDGMIIPDLPFADYMKEYKAIAERNNLKMIMLITCLLYTSLESSDFHGNENSLSYIALCPLASIGINNGECTAVFPDRKSEVTALTGTFNVAEAMNAFLKRFSIEGPDRKVCGLFGYTAFDAVRYFENIPVMEAHHEENDAPDMLYILYKLSLIHIFVWKTRKDECRHSGSDGR